MLTSLIICPIPDLYPAGTQAQNNDQRRSLTDLIIWPPSPTLIKYRLQSHPSLLIAILRSAYFAVLCSLALLASVSQGQVSSTMLNMHRSINDDKVRSLSLHHDVSRDQPAARGLQSIQVTVQLNRTLAHKGRLQANPRCDSGRNCASRSTFPSPMRVYNGREHGTESASPCSHGAGN
jgi:hypothetical protein